MRTQIDHIWIATIGDLELHMGMDNHMHGGQGLDIFQTPNNVDYTVGCNLERNSVAMTDVRSNSNVVI